MRVPVFIYDQEDEKRDARLACPATVRLTERDVLNIRTFLTYYQHQNPGGEITRKVLDALIAKLSKQEN